MHFMTLLWHFKALFNSLRPIKIAVEEQSKPLVCILPSGSTLLTFNLMFLWKKRVKVRRGNA